MGTMNDQFTHSNPLSDTIHDAGMQQDRIEDSFNRIVPQTPSRCSFLDLPEHVRRRIYDYSGLTGNCIDLNKFGLKVYPRDSYPDDRSAFRVRCLCQLGDSCIWPIDTSAPDDIWELRDRESWPGELAQRNRTCCVKPTYSLLFVARKIHQEVEPLIYSNNAFRISRVNAVSVRTLLQLSGRAISSMSSLTVSVDTRPSDPQQWDPLFARIAADIRPGHLNLCINGYVPASIAEAVLDDAMELPTLKGCAIDMTALVFQEPRPYPIREASVDAGLSRRIGQTIRSLTTVPSSQQSSFRFLDLPPEIRLMVMEYTDLVSADDIQWRPQAPHHSGCPCRNCGRQLDSALESDCLCDEIQRADHQCCGHCRVTSEAESHWRLAEDCYCSTRSPTDKRSSACVCVKQRHPLFSVCRELREEAIATYYLRNRFVVTPRGSALIRHIKNSDWLYFEPRFPYGGYDYHPTDCFPLCKIELSLYISSLARNALQHIKWLEWVLSESAAFQILKDSNTSKRQDFLDTLRLMEQEMTLPNLTLVLNLTMTRLFFWADLDHFDFEHHGFDTPTDFKITDYALFDELSQKWSRLVCPLQKLGCAGLKNFFIYLEKGNMSEEGRLSHEERLERLVMGAQYDSSQRGKPQERFAGFYD